MCMTREKKWTGSPTEVKWAWKVICYQHKYSSVIGTLGKGEWITGPCYGIKVKYGKWLESEYDKGGPSLRDRLKEGGWYVFPEKEDAESWCLDRSEKVVRVKVKGIIAYGKCDGLPVCRAKYIYFVKPTQRRKVIK